MVDKAKGDVMSKSDAKKNIQTAPPIPLLLAKKIGGGLVFYQFLGPAGPLLLRDSTYLTLTEINHQYVFLLEKVYLIVP